MSRPLAWVSRPVCVVGDWAERPAEPTNHLAYRRIYEAHGRSWCTAATVGPVPDAWPRSAEELALDALGPLLDGHQPSSVGAFVDCRSGAMIGGPAPTYRLAMSAGLTTATPVCLWGQDGPELIFGLSIAARRLPSDGAAVVSACQRIASPDTRAPGWTSRALGDAAAAVLVRQQPFPGGRPVLALQLERRRIAGSDLVERTLHQAGLRRELCGWTVIADPLMAPAADASRWPATYFGVADLFVRMADCSAEDDRHGIGAFLAHGRAGTSAAMILGAEERNVE